MTFEVFMVMIIIEILILSAMRPCSLVRCYHILRGTSYLNMKAECSFRSCYPSAKLHGVITHERSVTAHPQKISILIQEISVYKLHYTCN